MTRLSIEMCVTELKNIPVGSLFIKINDVQHNIPPTICTKTGETRDGNSATFTFGISTGFSIHISGDTLVIPFCGDHSG